MLSDHEQQATRREKLLALHKNLVEIESINGKEHNVGVFVGRYLADHGVHVEMQALISPSESPVSLMRLPTRQNAFVYFGSDRLASVW